MARFLTTKRRIDGIWVPRVPEFSWDSTEQNTGIPGPPITIRFHNGALDTRVYEALGPEIPDIVAQRLRMHENFGALFDEEAAVVAEDLKNQRVSTELNSIVLAASEVIGAGLTIEEVLERIRGFQAVQNGTVVPDPDDQELVGFPLPKRGRRPAAVAA